MLPPLLFLPLYYSLMDYDHFSASVCEFADADQDVGIRMCCLLLLLFGNSSAASVGEGWVAYFVIIILFVLCTGVLNVTCHSL